jgi:hypothetical protein
VKSPTVSSNHGGEEYRRIDSIYSVSWPLMPNKSNIRELARVLLLWSSNITYSRIFVSGLCCRYTFASMILAHDFPENSPHMRVQRLSILRYSFPP